MKKHLLTTLIFLGLILTAQAQTKIGIHFGYGTEIEELNYEFITAGYVLVNPKYNTYK